MTRRIRRDHAGYLGQVCIHAVVLAMQGRWTMPPVGITLTGWAPGVCAEVRATTRRACERGTEQL